MAKFSKDAAVAVKSAIKTISQSPDTVTAEGGAGFARDEKSELYLLAVTNMVSESTFYENGKDRDSRFESLIAAVTKADPSWIARFVPFLRNTMNMRSASLVLAAEYVRAGGPNGRKVIDSALMRADEPAELLAYWLTRYGKKLPQPVKRGLADAARRLYTERSVLKYDGDGAVRMADVLEFAHPSPSAKWQEALFQYIISTRHKRDKIDTAALLTIQSHETLAKWPTEALRTLIATPEGPETLAAGGWTWEALTGKYGKLDAAFWEAMIPNMGIFALTRNLRNFDDAGISVEARNAVIAKLTDPDVIAASRMFPLRFYSAYANTGSLNWALALETALNLSLVNVPVLAGKTLVLVDMSGSMNAPLSEKSKIARDKAAGIFGTALALRANAADLVGFGTDSVAVAFRKGDSALKTMEKFRAMGGTNTMQAINRHFSGHDRIVILTDEQAFSDYGSNIKVSQIDVPIYTFNLAGYKAGHLSSGPKRHTFGGLTDSGFVALSLLERGKDADWPF
jgi:hypothetical protein